MNTGALDSIIGEGLAKSPYQLAIERIKELEDKIAYLKEKHGLIYVDKEGNFQYLLTDADYAID